MGSTRFGYVFLIFLISLRSLDSVKDTLNQNDTLTGNQTLVSSGERFEFGFFDLRNTTDGISRYYVGIWYHGILPRTVVWVANREDPFGNSSGFIGFRSGNLMVSGDVNLSSIWWSMDTGSNVNGINLIVQIKDYGNLEFIQVENDILIWQSFQFPTDTFLPGQMLILDNSKNELTTLKPWTNDADPSPGNFSLFLDPRGFSSSYFQLLTVDNPNTEMSANSTSIGTGDVIHWRSGLWSRSPVAGGFNGIKEIPPNGIYGFSLIPNVNGDGAQYTYRRQKNDDDLRVRFVLLGIGTLTTYIYQQNKWIYDWSLPIEGCDFYNYCGKNAVCDQTNNPRCQCLLGFKPSLASEWDRGNWSAGCTRNTKIKDGCQPTDIGFLNLTHVKTPDLQTVYRPANATTTSESICGEYCMKSCNCTAYVYIDNNGCYTWDGDLFDLQNLTRISRGSKLSIKLNVTDLPPILGGTKEMSRAGTVVAIVLTVFGISIFLVFTIFIWTRYKLNFKGIFRDKFKISSLIISSNFSLDSVRDNELSGEQRSPVEQQQSPIEQQRSPVEQQQSLIEQQLSPVELPLLDLKVIRSATNDFSESNFLGKGGFGHVYKGVLPEGDVVAMKRLSKNSFQGLVEFKNEMMLIAKLQHRNLVRMKGVCIQESEQILVYEYMSNKSLDDFIFNREKNHIIDWKTRFGIIQGIARGILYLHRDSRLPIVHRDLKASNILLDDEMNPKISDFGMARIFGGNQDDQDKTNRIVGTFGYMSPEYAMKGMFSVKSDVYSFGVLILEIICGIKINRFETDENLNLLGYAWKLWIEDKGMELVDPIIKNTCSKEDDVLRCEHVALLCVQDRPIDRPTMSDIVMMLGTELSIKQIPEEPTFTIDKSFVENVVTTHARYIHEQNFSPNELTISELTFR